jgi:hypothetical protein
MPLPCANDAGALRGAAHVFVNQARVIFIEKRRPNVWWLSKRAASLPPLLRFFEDMQDGRNNSLAGQAENSLNFFRKMFGG